MTALTIAFLLYYGNNPQETVNTALEHTDPPLLIPRPIIPIVETRRPSTKDRLIQQSRTTLTNSPRNLISRGSIIDEDKIVESMESMQTHEFEKKSKNIGFEFIIYDTYVSLYLCIDSYGYELTNDLRERIQDELFRESVCTLIKYD